MAIIGSSGVFIDGMTTCSVMNKMLLLKRRRRRKGKMSCIFAEVAWSSRWCCLAPVLAWTCLCSWGSWSCCNVPRPSCRDSWEADAMCNLWCWWQTLYKYPTCQFLAIASLVSSHNIPPQSDPLICWGVLLGINCAGVFNLSSGWMRLLDNSPSRRLLNLSVS